MTEETKTELYTTLAGEGSDEFEEKRSIFIGHAKHITSEEEAMEFVKAKKKEYADATHNCWAYLLKGGIVARYSDDGEPQGTAGVPMLETIRKSGVTDCVVVVTRYFGGTLLGTGGLVRAYSAASSGAITSAQIITYDIYCEIKISCDYSDYGKITPIFDELSFRVTDTEYAEGITVIGKIEKAKADELKLKLTEITSARSGYEILGEKYDF
jgi:uncharacterized YigZ family protein